MNVIKIKKPEDFVVREIIDKKFTRRFTRTGSGVEKTGSPYTLFLLKKTDMTTARAIRTIAKHLGIKERDIGYAGLKDKFAVTYQYITIRNGKIAEEKIKEMNANNNIELKKIGYTDKMISIGDLAGNEFEITLHRCKDAKKIERGLVKLIKNGMPNYFGQQRFGKGNDNHIVGRHLIKRQFKKALAIISKNCKAHYNNIEHLDKKMLKFFIHAYQSWIFNETIKAYIQKNRAPCFCDINVFGYDTKLGSSVFDNIIKKIIKNEKIRQKDFMINELRICCTGAGRKAFIKLTGIDYEIGKNSVMMRFSLPGGSYATVMLNEICK